MICWYAADINYPFVKKQAGEDETKNDDKKENIDRKHICRIAYGFYAIYLSITNTTGSNK